MTTKIHPTILDVRRQFINRLIVKENKFEKIIAPPIVTPTTIAIQYVSKTLTVQRKINQRVLDYADQMLAHLEVIRSDAFDDDIDSTFSEMERYLIGLLGLDAFGLIANYTANDVFAFNQSKYDRGIYGAMGLNNISNSDLARMRTSWVKENVSLITAANTEQLSKVENIFRRASRDGMSRELIKDQVRRALATSESRAALIADDQIYKLDGQVDKFKQESAGLTTYIWRTMLDNRVRPKHRSLEGKRRSWKNDSPHPGQEVRCRCFAQPDIKRFFGTE
jgi:SPP1 gp7 family putative phage head morphogenesis protein